MIEEADNFKKNVLEPSKRLADALEWGKVGIDEILEASKSMQEENTTLQSTISIYKEALEDTRFLIEKYERGILTYPDASVLLNIVLNIAKQALKGKQSSQDNS